MTEHAYAGYVTHASASVSWECSCNTTGATIYPPPPFNAEARFAWLQRIKADHGLHAVAEEEAG